MLSLPSGSEMTELANLRRKSELEKEKLRKKNLPKFSYRRILGMLKGNHKFLVTGAFGGILLGTVRKIFFL